MRPIGPSGKPVGELIGALGVVDDGPGDHDVLFGFSRPFDISDDNSTERAALIAL